MQRSRGGTREYRNVCLVHFLGIRIDISQEDWSSKIHTNSSKGNFVRDFESGNGGWVGALYGFPSSFLQVAHRDTESRLACLPLTIQYLDRKSVNVSLNPLSMTLLRLSLIIRTVKWCLRGRIVGKWAAYCMGALCNPPPHLNIPSSWNSLNYTRVCSTFSSSRIHHWAWLIHSFCATYFFWVYCQWTWLSLTFLRAWRST